MDNELVEELRKTINKLGSINELNEEYSKPLVDDVAVQYIADRNLVWWWEGLLEKLVVIKYGDSLGWNYEDVLFDSLWGRFFSIPLRIQLRPPS